MSARPTLSRLAALNKHYQTSEVNQGYGSLGVWPDEGVSKEHTVRITGYTFNDKAKFEYSIGTQKKPVDAFSIQFHYETDTPTGPLAFRGAPMVIPFDIDSLPETANKTAGGKQQSRANIQLARLNGHLEVLLSRGRSPDLSADVDEVFRMLDDAVASATAIMAKVYLEFRSRDYVQGGEKKTANEKVDYLRELISGPVG